LSRADSWNEAIAEVFEHPESAVDAPWVALLSYESLLTLRRAVALYAGDFARSHRRSYWHGLPGFDEPLAHLPRARAAVPYPTRGDAPIRARLRLDDRAAPATLRRFSPAVPTSLS
jgi:hypothetical protein